MSSPLSLAGHSTSGPDAASVAVPGKSGIDMPGIDMPGIDMPGINMPGINMPGLVAINDGNAGQVPASLHDVVFAAIGPPVVRWHCRLLLQTSSPWDAVYPCRVMK